MHLLNTHNYDNKLKDTCQQILEKYQTNISFEETIEKFRDMSKLLNYDSMGQVVQTLHLFINDI